ncbi:hypothetical protein BU26DRAFT_522144 [Trematosphaeria pertusa]|uniref:Uncharacterized protein n=1 Tax=Trematosphaeria pertusa TaxID=390896 RepID=A0A6A6I6A3_9PLEO|nr:uncharacterized protein BU26DRAFT_522144 [Trematosphaeria pertusa]KAF2245759.1 hypothetical protein BU26DRAFT_522144 [Trematosphaeria pertusa]
MRLPFFSVRLPPKRQITLSEQQFFILNSDLIIVEEALRKLNNEITSLRKDQELKNAALEDSVLRLNTAFQEMEGAIGELRRAMMGLHSESVS